MKRSILIYTSVFLWGATFYCGIQSIVLIFETLEAVRDRALYTQTGTHLILTGICMMTGLVLTLSIPEKPKPP